MILNTTDLAIFLALALLGWALTAWSARQDRKRHGEELALTMEMGKSIGRMEQVIADAKADHERWVQEKLTRPEVKLDSLLIARGMSVAVEGLEAQRIERCSEACLTGHTLDPMECDEAPERHQTADDAFENEHKPQTCLVAGCADCKAISDAARAFREEH